MMMVRKLVASGLAAAALAGGIWSGAAGALASTTPAHVPHNKCVPAGQTGPGKPCTVKPKPTHVPKPKPTHVPKPKPTHVPKPKPSGTPHTSHKHTPTPKPGM